MSGLRVGHVREMPLKSGIEAGYACLSLESTTKNACQARHIWPDMYLLNSTELLKLK
jgi:hypothetical protein